MIPFDIRVYICGPITPKGEYSIIDNTAQAVDVYFRLTEKGILSFCPHLGGGFPDAFHVSWEKWLDYDEYWVKEWATHVLLLPRWHLSEGATIEEGWARAAGKELITVEDIETLGL